MVSYPMTTYGGWLLKTKAVKIRSITVVEVCIKAWHVVTLVLFQNEILYFISVHVVKRCVLVLNTMCR